jgi:type VI secretion system secreted protein VgrG
VAKNQQTDPLEVLENLKGFLEQIEQHDQNKADAFKQAIMILSAPNSVAVSSNEDLYLSADGQISQSAGESINLSTQKSLIAHASEKISLFAAQDGLRAYAGKGKVEIQAQGDALDVIARKDIQIISTEEQIEIKANKKIVLTAGGSQIEISGAGVLPTTAGKFEVRRAASVFGSASVNVPAIDLPDCSAKQTQAAQKWFCKG